MSAILLGDTIVPHTEQVPPFYYGIFRGDHNLNRLNHQNALFRLDYLEEREYEVCAEGIAVRTLPDERSPRTGNLPEGDQGLGLQGFSLTLKPGLRLQE